MLMVSNTKTLSTLPLHVATARWWTVSHYEWGKGGGECGGEGMKGEECEMGEECEGDGCTCC